ncbi:MAG: DNA-binding protein [Bradyrhizobium sp.]|nr:DNA-binding protein [Bradyrhizobium sp.]
MTAYQATMTVNEFRDWSRVGRTKIYELIARGDIKAIKIGRRTLIRADSARAWLDGLPSFAAGRS